MIPITGERGKMYYTVTCQNRDCKEKLYVQEVDSHSGEDLNRNRLAGESVRCLMCTQHTMIDPRCFVVIGVR